MYVRFLRTTSMPMLLVCLLRKTSIKTFSCFSRSLKKISARSVPALDASLTKSFSGIKVTWLRSGVNYWATISARWIKSITLSRSYAFELVMHEGKVVMRTKDAMSHESWLPLGGLQFAIPIFKPRVLTSSPRAFSFVVARIHPLVALRSCIEGQQERLCLVRSASTYPGTARCGVPMVARLPQRRTGTC